MELTWTDVFLNPNSQCISKSFWLYCVNIISTPLPGQHVGPSTHHLAKDHKNSTLNVVPALPGAALPSVHQ